MPETPIRVLHVDDDPGLLDLTRTFLARQDSCFDIRTATSAADGLDSITERAPDCVVSDYDMPGCDGIEFLRQVRESHPDLPFILFTGKGSESVASDAMAAGVTDYLQKGKGSERYELLANRITNAVEARRATREAVRQEELMRLTEFAGGTGGWEYDLEADELALTTGARRLTGLSRSEVSPESLLELYHPEDRDAVRTAGENAMQTGEETTGTWRLQPQDGDERLVDVTITPVTEDGDTTGLRGSLKDVTDALERQRELRRLQQAIDGANVAITLADPTQEDNPLVYVNDAYGELTGYSKEESLGRNCRFLQGPDTDPERIAALREAIDEEEPITVEFRNYRKDGTEFWNRLTVAPIYDDDGTLVRYLGTQTDITERKERERELETQRRFTQQALNALEDQFFVLGTDGTISRWNDRVTEVTGYAESELNGMDAIEVFPEDERDPVADAIGRTLSTGQATIEADLQTADGDRIPYEWVGARLSDGDGNTTGIVGIGRDISERRQRQRRFQALVEQSTDIISVIDADGRIQYQSPSLERILGHDPDGTVGNLAWEYVHPDDRANIKRTFEEWKTGAGEREPIEYRARHADGSWRWFEARGTEQFDDPDVEGYVVNSRDVTERKERTEEILELKRQYQTLSENVPNGAVFLFDDDLRYVRARGTELEAVGISPDDIEGSTPRDVFPGETADELARYYTETLEGHSHTFTQTLEGNTYRSRTVPVEDSTGQITYGMVLTQNVTDRVERRRKLEAQNERLEEFTSVVSHDLRNPLRTAGGRLELARDECDSDHLDGVAEALDRSEALIEDLLTLARGGDSVGRVEPVSVPSLADECWQVTPNDEATLAVDAEVTVSADRSRLRQLLENLLTNAIKHGGRDVTVRIGDLDDGLYVADDGTGIPAGERTDVFEAGYSTAEDGTGFGLRIVQGIAEAHGWELGITDSDEGGARIEITGVEFVE
jgi:PAS domain S-box-containing protein